MFDYPLSIPGGTSYDQLGVGPEAEPQEISEAKLALSRRLKEAKGEVASQCEQVVGQVEGLRGAYDLVASLEGRGENVDSESLREAHADLARLEREAKRINPEFKQLRKRLSQYERDIEALNLLKVQNAAGRCEYDLAHPPLGLLKLTDPNRDAFATDQDLVLPLIRRELAEFFRQQGEEVFHPTDLTRADFSGDFTRVDLLDGEET